ncbi:peroxidasin homolog [Pararge aegeria]|nr:peroxidasin homolog [Pararge aegeria]
MPMLNASVTKDLHSITIIERNQNKNHSFSETKNISTIIVKYCDKENLTTVNVTDTKPPDEDVKGISVQEEYDDYNMDDDIDYDDSNPDKMTNITIESRKDVLEAAEYGMRKMHELYGVLEPKLYSMGLILDDKDPARYVAAFNAPSEDIAQYAKYGYASLQAASRFKELISIENGDSLESRTEDSQLPGASALRQSPLLEQCPLKSPPKCPPASKRYRTHDGTCNNLSRPRWGATMTPVQRFIQPVYSDGIQAPRRSIFGSKLPSAREISALVHEDKNAENPGITHLLMQWGQFLDHDVTASSQSRGFNGSVPRCCKNGGRDFIPKELMHPECMPIAVPPSDTFYGPRGVRCLDFVRSSPAPRDDCALGWREQFNQVSAYIDGSPLYASSARQSDKLRLFRNGMLQYGKVQQRRPLLPTDRDELCRGGAVSTDCFKSGDARVNEHPGLVAAHIVWLRQHNRMAQELAHLNPHWSDEKIYQETRKIVGAMIQHITYREFLPIVLGSEVMRLFELELQQKGFYRGYSPKINASPASSFGSAAFRFGHSLVQPSMMRFDRFHRPIANNVSLHDELTNPSNIWSMGAVDRLLLGMVNQPIQKRDEFITEELTNHLFQTPHFNFGMDLAAINIQRGRDHGVPPYTSWREPCGLTAITSFDDLYRVMPARAVRKVKVLYKHVDDIDLFTGGMAERPVVGGLVGPTFACIIAQQFTNLKKGDRFWYENGGFESSLTPAQLQQIRRISLAQVLCRTLDSIDSIQPFVFLSPNNPDNDRISCRNGHLNNFDLSPWVEINSDSNNDIKKSEDSSTLKPGKPKPTTTKPKTTRKPQKVTKAPDINKPNAAILSKPQKQNHRLNRTDTTEKNTTKTTTDNPNSIPIVQVIDDKLDFKIKTRRYSDSDPDTRQYNNDYYDDVQSVQSVVVNNLPHKRPNSRPYISVTENIDKYTYLINYVPRPTQTWRQTTRRHGYDKDKNDRDVVKVTYQSYDDTYRRPNRPYFNRHEFDNNFESRVNVPVTESSRSSARSNDDNTSTSNDKLSTEMFIMTNRPKPLTDKTTEKIDPTTENIYKLLTFGYVGTYKGGVTNDKTSTDKIKPESISKDFSTMKTDKSDEGTNDQNHGNLSTFMLYDSVTKPYNSQRPTRRNDEDETLTSDIKDKYYFIHNVLRKYPISTDQKLKNVQKQNEPDKPYDTLTSSNNKMDIQERSGTDQIESTGEVTASRGDKPRLNKRKPSNSAKTPSVAFQIIPSENNPSQWAVYDEKEDLPENLPQRMPAIKLDPYALREIPRPIDFNSSRRRPGRRRT